MYVSDLIVEFQVRFPGDKIFRLRLHQTLIHWTVTPSLVEAFYEASGEDYIN